MFENIGGKIKGLAKIICWLGIIICVITGIVLFSQAGDTYNRSAKTTLIVTGLLIMVGGSVLSWVSSFVLYGFGELVENSSTIATNMNSKQTVSDSRTGESSGTTSSGKYWTCPNCKKQNPLTTSICICGTPKPEQRRVDWTCKYCGATNKYYSDTCVKCYRHKDA